MRGDSVGSLETPLGLDRDGVALSSSWKLFESGFGSPSTLLPTLLHRARIGGHPVWEAPETETPRYITGQEYQK